MEVSAPVSTHSAEVLVERHHELEGGARGPMEQPPKLSKSLNPSAECSLSEGVGVRKRLSKFLAKKGGNSLGKVPLLGCSGTFASRIINLRRGKSLRIRPALVGHKKMGGSKKKEDSRSALCAHTTFLQGLISCTLTLYGNTKTGKENSQEPPAKRGKTRGGLWGKEETAPCTHCF